MKTTCYTLALTTILAFGTAAYAAEVKDTDGDGVFSIEELTAAYPALTPELFGAIDGNGDGVVDADELDAAVKSGVLVAG